MTYQQTRELEARRIATAQRELRAIRGARRSCYGAPVEPQRALASIEWCDKSGVPKDRCEGCQR